MSKHIRTRILLRIPRLTAGIQTRLRIALAPAPAPAPAPDILGPHGPCLTFSRLLQKFYRTLVLRRAWRILEVL